MPVQRHTTKPFKARFAACLLVGLLIAASLGRCAALAAELTRVAVPENEFNRTAEQLKAKELRINEREAALNTLQEKLEQDNRQVVVMIVILFALILANFMLDFHRRKRSGSNIGDKTKTLLNV